MKLNRMTAEFVYHWHRLREATGDDPSNVKAALDRHPNLEVSIERLCDLMEEVRYHRKYARRRFFVQAHEEFRSAVIDFECRWYAAGDELDGWREAHGYVVGTAEMLGLLDPENTTYPSIANEDRLPSDFDPHRDDLGWIMTEIERDFREWGEPVELQRSEALAWLRDTMGIDFRELQDRWNDFPMYIVPQPVSDRYSLDGSDGLFGYLNQIRLAYLVGADRAALALCRVVTELLFKFHYASDLKLKDERTGLPKLIEMIEASGRYDFLKKLNLAEKVRDANAILHDARGELRKHRDRDRAVIASWLRALEEVIEEAPKGGEFEGSPDDLFKVAH